MDINSIRVGWTGRHHRPVTDAIGTTNVDIFSFSYDENTTVHLLDTPGFDDTNRSDVDVLREISRSLSILYAQRMPLAGAIYLSRITDRRMAGSAMKSLRIFEGLAGPRAFSSTMLVTTMWDRLNQAEHAAAVERERQLLTQDQFWGRMAKGGASAVRSYNDTSSAWGIVSALVRRRTTVKLDIQREMVDQHKALDETTAGKLLLGEHALARQRVERDISELDESIRAAYEEKDSETVAELVQQRDSIAAGLERSESSIPNLRVQFNALAATDSDRYANLERQLAIEQQKRALELELERRQPSSRDLEDGRSEGRNQWVHKRHSSDREGSSGQVNYPRLPSSTSSPNPRYQTRRPRPRESGIGKALKGLVTMGFAAHQGAEIGLAVASSVQAMQGAQAAWRDR